jgi:uncharacterized membrane protein required for colicin V production
MTFTPLDLIIVAVIVALAVIGFMMGLIQGIGALLGVALGFWAATSFFQAVSGWLEPISFGHPIGAKIVTFIVIFLLINKLTGLVFWLLDRAFRIISIVPFLKSFNRLGGLILGLLEAVLVCGLLLSFLNTFSVDWPWLAGHLQGSKFSAYLIGSADYLIALGQSLFQKYWPR